MKKQYFEPYTFRADFELESHLMGFSNETPSQPADPVFGAPHTRSYRALIK